MRNVALFVMTLLLLKPTFAVDKALFIFGGQGHKEFLGCLNCSESHPKSVWNDLSTFGFKNDFGIWNPFKEFASQFSSYSMCNQFASDSPIIVDEEGGSYGRLSIAEFKSGSICAPMSNADQLCRAIKAVCESKT